MWGNNTSDTSCENTLTFESEPITTLESTLSRSNHSRNGRGGQENDEKCNNFCATQHNSADSAVPITQKPFLMSSYRWEEGTDEKQEPKILIPKITGEASDFSKQRTRFKIGGTHSSVASFASTYNNLQACLFVLICARLEPITRLGFWCKFVAIPT